jgi:hypothetical protein
MQEQDIAYLEFVPGVARYPAFAPVPKFDYDRSLVGDADDPTELTDLSIKR